MNLAQTLTSATLLTGVLIAAQPVQADENSPFHLNLGGETSLTFYGYAKLSVIQDYDYDLGNTTIGLKNIGLPAGPAAGEFDRMHLKESRIGMDFASGDFRAKLEGDFFGDDGLRLRHAIVSWNGLMVGQYWTNFMSVENLGKTVDFQGPAGVPFARLPQIRYTYNAPNKWAFSASVEQDKSNEDDLHYTVAARREYDRGLVRVAGLYRDTTLSGTPVQGWGLTVGGGIDTWAGGRLTGIYTTGESISDILAFGLDGTALSVGGNGVGVNSVSIMVSHLVGKKLTLAATAGLTDLDVATGTDTKRLTTLHLSAFYDVTKDFQISCEYYTGTRKQGDGVSFDADRAMLAAKISF